MKAIVYEEYGPPQVLQLKDLPKPQPKNNEVLIQVHAATVVAGDCEFRSFKFPLWFWLPLRMYAGLLRPKRVKILGQELAGIVEAVGKDVTRFQPGDEVFAATEVAMGAYAEYRCLAENKPIAIKPANMTFDEAAAIPTGGLNALHYLRKANLQPGEKILINGACGNIGSFAVQLAKHHFATEVTAVDHPGKLDVLRSIGADHVIDYTREKFTENGEKYDAILDVIGKSSYSRSLRSLTSNGRLVLANPRPLQMLRGLWTTNTSSKKVRYQFCDYNVEDMEFLKELIEAGKLTSVIDRIWPLEGIVEAHRYVDAKLHKGNVVIKMVT